uniref:Uncharacterized protein n=1 Tax=Oryza barthii TaxID=65489 RepID=A0A0D3FST1_9ORYZ
MAARSISTEKGAGDHGEGRAATAARSMATAARSMVTAVEWRRGRRSMGRRTWRLWRGEATRRRGLIASRWRRGAGEDDGDGGGSQAGAETLAEEKAARATRKGFDGGKPPIAGEADVDGGALAGEKAARKGEGDEGAEKATALEAAREMVGDGGGDGGEWRRGGLGGHFVA